MISARDSITILRFILKFKSHMLEKINVIAITENTVSSCVQ